MNYALLSHLQHSVNTRVLQITAVAEVANHIGAGILLETELKHTHARARVRARTHKAITQQVCVGRRC